jgi:hypothetical protein
MPRPYMPGVLLGVDLLAAGGFASSLRAGCPLTERALPGNRLAVGATHSEGACTLWAVSRQKQDVPRAHIREECVALFGMAFFPGEGEAFPGGGL